VIPLVDVASGITPGYLGMMLVFKNDREMLVAFLLVVLKTVGQCLFAILNQTFDVLDATDQVFVFFLTGEITGAIENVVSPTR